MDDVMRTEYDGCGMCFVATRRLSRSTDSTSSPEKQANQTIDAVAQVGGHIIAWADDWEVSGATDPMTRKGLGPWLRGEMGPYDGMAAASVDRLRRPPHACTHRVPRSPGTLRQSQDRQSCA